MTQEEKQLLLKELCARLPYSIIVKMADGGIEPLLNVNVDTFICNGLKGLPIPYLRPMSSMTEEEENEYEAINCYEGLFPRNEDALDYVLEHHLDFRGLILRGLALEAPEDMYKTE